MECVVGRTLEVDLGGHMELGRVGQEQGTAAKAGVSSACWLVVTVMRHLSEGLVWLMVLEVSGNDLLTLMSFDPLARPYTMVGAYGDANCLPHG